MVPTKIPKNIKKKNSVQASSLILHLTINTPTNTYLYAPIPPSTHTLILTTPQRKNPTSPPHINLYPPLHPPAQIQPNHKTHQNPPHENLPQPTHHFINTQLPTLPNPYATMMTQHPSLENVNICIHPRSARDMIQPRQSPPSRFGRVFIECRGDQGDGCFARVVEDGVADVGVEESGDGG